MSKCLGGPCAVSLLKFVPNRLSMDSSILFKNGLIQTSVDPCIPLFKNSDRFDRLWFPAFPFENSDQIDGLWIPGSPFKKFEPKLPSKDPCIPLYKFGPNRRSVDPCIPSKTLDRFSGPLIPEFLL